MSEDGKVTIRRFGTGVRGLDEMVMPTTLPLKSVAKVVNGRSKSKRVTKASRGLTAHLLRPNHVVNLFPSLAECCPLGPLGGGERAML
jgi:hypothetical protein